MKPDFFDYAVIVAATAGTLVYLFLMILIVGYRRRRTFERVLFFLALAAFFSYGGILLGVNAELFYRASPPIETTAIAGGLIAIGLFFLPSLVLHAHLALAHALEPRTTNRLIRYLIVAAYVVPAVLVFSRIIGRPGSADAQIIRRDFSDVDWRELAWIVFVLLVLLVSIRSQLRFASQRGVLPDASDASYFRFITLSFGIIAVGFLAIVLQPPHWRFAQWPVAIVMAAATLPGSAIAFGVVRRSFLGISVQKNLVYGVTAGFLAILYLAMVRRISGWLEPYFPPEATSAVLIFMLIGLFEPLQRFANRVLRRNVEQQLEQLQRLTNELQRAARDGDVLQLTAFAERRIREEFGLDIVKLNLGAGASGVKTPEATRPSVPDVRPEGLTHKPGRENSYPNVGRIHSVTRSEAAELDRPAWAGQPVRFALGKAGAEIGELIAIPIGSSISGETHAALEFLAEQLPGVIELCRAVDEKSRLERELAERERLALVGQMTASISHNLKNPIGSMKTVLQVQLENPRLDENVRRDLQMVLGELDRLGGKLNALLRYARPAVRGAETARQIEVAQVAAEIVVLMKNEAAGKDVTLQIHEAPNCGCIRGSDEALNDILSNLVVNAIEAVAKSGRVDVRLGGDESNVEIVLADDGPGIPADQISRLFQPFFTTKANGTGLGLAIVRRRAAELGGTVTCKSPLEGGHGTEFVVRLPRMKC